MTDLSPRTTRAIVDQTWDDSIVPQLIEYVAIPNKSPMFDPDWAEHGYMEDAVTLMTNWCREQAVSGLDLEVVRLPGRTPVIVMEIPGNTDGCVLLYGHLDKQPEMTGWSDDLGPWKPVLKGSRLYGRGGADDGYALFASLTAIRAIKDQGLPHPRCFVLIEACEESGSYDLPFYLDTLESRIGNPDLVVCLDSGCGNYDQLWVTTSLRGIAAGTMSVELISEGVHSGDAGGLVADSFRVLRRVLERLEDAESGRILPDSFHVEIPDQRVEQARVAAQVLDDQVYRKLPFLPGVGPVSDDLVELILNRTWRPALAVTGAHGLPSLDAAGNVCRPLTAVKLSLRLPPTCDPERASAGLREILERNPPYGARVRFHGDQASGGWNAPPVSPWLEEAAESASQAYFGERAVYMGEGGTIPFMAMLGEKYPDAQFLITGVLGPHSNAHGPNEFLDIPTGKRLTCCVADIIARHAMRG